MQIGPLLFRPYLRPQIWGGRRLGTLFGKHLPDEGRYGESWEISGHPHHVSIVESGPLAGRRLDELCRDHASDIFGDAFPSDGRFPLLVKILDCEELLSIQVHPNDETAARLLGNEKGKFEAWIVLAAEPTGRIYAGLRSGVTRKELEAAIADQTLEMCLESFQPSVGDCLFLPAGIVHAVGGGVVMAEVQQSSDATFRLYDWNRPGPDSKPRALHLREAFESIDFSAGPVKPAAGSRIEGLGAGCLGESLVRCPFFNLARYTLTDQMEIEPGRLSIWMVLGGAAGLTGAAGKLMLERGQTVLIPAASPRVSISPAQTAQFVQLLGVTLFS